MSGSDPESGALLRMVAPDPEWWREDVLGREEKARRDMRGSALYGAGGLALCGVLIYLGATGASGGYLGWMFICVYAALFVFGVRSYRSEMRKRRRVLAAANQLLGIRKVVMMNHAPQFRGQLDLFTGQQITPEELADEETEYRIDFQIMWRPPGEEDFTEFAFGSTTAETTIDTAAHMALSCLQNKEFDITIEHEPAHAKRFLQAGV